MEKLRYTKYVFKYKWSQLVAFLSLLLSAMIAYLLPYATMKIIDGLTLDFSMQIVISYAMIYLLVQYFFDNHILYSSIF